MNHLTRLPARRNRSLAARLGNSALHGFLAWVFVAATFLFYDVMQQTMWSVGQGGVYA